MNELSRRTVPGLGAVVTAACDCQTLVAGLERVVAGSECFRMQDRYYTAHFGPGLTGPSY